jgi:hypothetical protein
MEEEELLFLGMEWQLALNGEGFGNRSFSLFD